MHGVEKPFVCSSITPEKLERKARREKAICAFFNHTRKTGEESTEWKSHLCVLQPHQRNWRGKHGVEKPFVCSSITPEKLERKARSGKAICVFFNHTRETGEESTEWKSHLCVLQSHQRNWRGKHGEKKPFVCSSITPEKLERKARREKAICAFFNHTREIGEESTERKNHFVCSSITPEKLERKARRGKTILCVLQSHQRNWRGKHGEEK